MLGGKALPSPGQEPTTPQTMKPKSAVSCRAIRPGTLDDWLLAYGPIVDAKLWPVAGAI
jgi:hypothetical protein